VLAGFSGSGDVSARVPRGIPRAGGVFAAGLSPARRAPARATCRAAASAVHPPAAGLPRRSAGKAGATGAGLAIGVCPWPPAG